MLQNFLTAAFRNLWRHKVFTLINIGGLMLGVGSSIVLFINIKFHQDFNLSQSNYDRIYRIAGQYQSVDNQGNTKTVPHPLGKLLKSEAGFYDKISRIKTHGSVQVNVKQKGIVKKFMQRGAVFAEDDIFKIFDFEWLAGQGDLASPRSAVISAPTARKFFGDHPLPSIIGEVITVDNLHEMTVKGVFEEMPRDSDMSAFNLLMDYESQEGINDYYGEGKIWGRLNGGTQLFGLLSMGYDPFLAQQETNEIYEEHNVIDGYTLMLQPMSDLHFNADLGGFMGGPPFPDWATWTLSTLALLLIVASSINFINLSTAQATNRAKEVGIRKVLGSKREQLIFQHLLETFMIVMISFIGSLAIAELLFKWIEPIIEVSLSLMDVSRIWLITFGILLLLGLTLLTGLYPAFVISSFSPIRALKSTFGSVKSKGSLSLRRILVTVQFVISQALLIGILVLIWQNEFLRSQDLGFKHSGIISLILPEADNDKTRVFMSELQMHPEFQTVSTHLGSPVARVNNTGSLLHYNDEGVEYEINDVNFKSVDENYLDLFEIELIAGQNLQKGDSSISILINKTLMRDLGIKDPYEALGLPLKTKWGSKYQIKGVIEDFNWRSLRNSLGPVIMNYQTDYFREVAIELINAKSEEKASALKKLEDAWEAVYPEHVLRYEYLEENIKEAYTMESKMIELFRLFAMLALVIGCLGLYGLIDFMAIKKTKEIGIRKVLGANIFNILMIFTKELLILVVLSLIISGPLMYWILNQWLDQYAYRIDLGWPIFLIAFLTVMVAALATMGYRSIKASQLNPVQTLKDE